jgi:hypothetical protein
MKLDEIQVLASNLNLDNILVKSEEVIFTMEEKGDLETTFPVPNCDRCAEKCCPNGVAISLYDVARFVDIDLVNFISGTLCRPFPFRRRRGKYKTLTSIYVWK